MSRPLTNLGKKVLDDKFIKKVTAEEENYSDYLNDFHPRPIESPLEILSTGAGVSGKMGFVDQNDMVNRKLLIMNEAGKAVHCMLYF